MATLKWQKSTQCTEVGALAQAGTGGANIGPPEWRIRVIRWKHAVLRGSYEPWSHLPRMALKGNLGAAVERPIT